MLRRAGSCFRAGPRASVWLAMIVAGLVTAFPSPSSATPEVHGAVDGRGLIETSGRYGGAVSADFWWGGGLLRAGLAAGVGAVSQRDDASSRVFTPLGLSLALMARDLEKGGPLATLRLGVAPGAEKGGFVVAGWAGCALGYRFALGEGASVRLGADAWLLFGPSGGLFLGPFLGLGF
jgi:hypothetical protein